MFGSYLPYVFGILLVTLSCNPGNYDVTACDPSVKTLDDDACNALNPKGADCTLLYQCDKATSSCKRGPRDYDRDGDPDKMCGGTDCNDYDNMISGINKMCGCDQQMLGAGCQVGVGACVASATYTCKDGALFCTVPNSPPVADPDYMKTQYMNVTWDWDCDGKQSLKCPDKNGALVDCPMMGNCGGTSFNVDSTATQVTDACNTFCTQYKYGLGGTDNCSPQDKTFVCDVGCGKPVFYCHCTVGSYSLGGGYPCNGNATPASTTVRCK